MPYHFPDDLKPDYCKKAQELGINQADIIEQFIRGTGKGGQKMNKTSSCVLLRYPFMGIEVRCQEYRQQSKNRLEGAKRLIDKVEFIIKGKESEKAKRIYKLIKQKRRRSKRAKEKILALKKQRSKVKEMRRKVMRFPDM